MIKVAVVTGAGSGIGRAAALALANAGYAVALAGRRQAELEGTAALAPGAAMLPMATDVSQPDSVHALFAATIERYGRLDLLFNNAGIFSGGTPTEDLPWQQWNDVVNINLTGSFLCAQEAIRQMKAQQPKGGRIINNGSVSAHAPRPHSVAYTATKHAITGLTKSISLDGRAHNIACGQIDVGNAGQMSGMPSASLLQPNGEMLAEPRMDVSNVGEAILFMANLPLDANVQFITIMATNMPFIGRG